MTYSARRNLGLFVFSAVQYRTAVHQTAGAQRYSENRMCLSKWLIIWRHLAMANMAAAGIQCHKRTGSVTIQPATSNLAGWRNAAVVVDKYHLNW